MAGDSTSGWSDDSGLILRGNAAVVGLIVMGILCLFAGPPGWILFAVILLVSGVLTGGAAALSKLERPRANPPTAPSGPPSAYYATSSEKFWNSQVASLMGPAQVNRFPRELVVKYDAWVSEPSQERLDEFLGVLRGKWGVIQLGVEDGTVIEALSRRFPEALQNPQVLFTLARLSSTGVRSAPEESA